MGRQGGVEKESKTLGTERCENIKNLYIKNCVLLLNSLEFFKTYIVRSFGMYKIKDPNYKCPIV